MVKTIRVWRVDEENRFGCPISSFYVIVMGLVMSKLVHFVQIIMHISAI